MKRIGKIVETIVDPDTGEVIRRKSTIHFPEQGKTRQELKDEVNINSIMARVRARQPIDMKPPGSGRFGDFSNPIDYTTQAEAIADANERFMELPAAVRAAVRNDPARLLAALGDADQTAALIELGLPAELRDAAPAASQAGASGAPAPPPAPPDPSGPSDPDPGA